MANTLRFKRGLVATIPTAAAGEPLFTTDTFDLYIGNGTGNTRFQKYIASGTTSQLLRGDGSLLTMPIVLTSPSSGQVLKYNGTSWVNDSDAGITGSGTTNYLPKFTGASTLGNSAITEDGTTVTLVSRALSGTSATFSGNVGIGMNPLSQLMVYGASETSNEVDGLRIRRNSIGADIRDLSININNGIVNFKTINNSGGKIGYKWLLKDSASEIEAMRLDSSGNLGLGVVPSNALAGAKTFELGASGILYSEGTSSSFNSLGIGVNWYYNASAALLYKNTGVAASRYGQYQGSHFWDTAPSGSANATITFVRPMTLTANGRLLLGSTSDTGELLQVNGTMKVTGAATFSSSVAATDLNVNRGGGAWQILPSSGESALYFKETTSGNIRMTIQGANVGIGTTSPDSKLTLSGTGTVRAKVISTDSQASFYLQGTFGQIENLAGDLYITNSAASSPIIFRANSATERMRLTATNGNLHIGTFVSDSGEKLQVNGTMKVTGASTFGGAKIGSNFQIDSNGDAYQLTTGGAALWAATANTTYPTYGFYGDTGIGMYRASADVLAFATNASERIRIDASGNFGIGNANPSYALDVTGSARVSDAIAIGTTPDTNKPFKILKNINDTVGIRFENTSTGSLAFSALQMGTDVTGGTKFTNLVYASSGVTASGVYNPDGTSLINSGSGGLNFLGNPIRMYTGGSNGTLRWDMTNDGFITQYTGTNPSTNATDGYRQYSADVVAGNAAPHFRTENGAIIKLYQETTAVGNSTISVGGGNAVLDDTEFGGYTLRQVVQALRNQGILA